MIRKIKKRIEMNSLDLMGMGLKNLWRRKLRTFLTILGVIIGASSIIVMLSLGFGISEAQKAQIESMGSLNIITVSKGYGGGLGGESSSSKEKILDKKALSELKAIKNVSAVMPVKTASGILIHGRYMSYTDLKGVPAEVMEDFDFKLESGRKLQNGDKYSLIMGGGAKNNFYKNNNMEGNPLEIDFLNESLKFTMDQQYGSKPIPGEKKIKYPEYKMKVVGVLEEGNMENDWSVFMPLDELEAMIKEKDKLVTDKSMKSTKGYDSFSVKVDDIKNVKDVQATIKEMGFEAYSLTDFLDEMNKFTAVIQAILGGIGAISLLVAAIGITNTMIMSIYERTKEIGIMKVIGASITDIRRLFLFESAVIGFMGGFIGLLFSLLISFLMNMIAPGLIPTGEANVNLSIIPWWLGVFSIVFSTAIGILAGYYPAKRAMNLSALEAIKTE